MNLIELIETKKRGKALSREQIACFADAAADPATPDYQLAALLMAIRLMGMDGEETAALTMAMAHTGDVLTPDVGGVPVDKHSTGGVGDTTTLILVPLVAACGGKVVKMSGRGLGHTGGTIDKMESIPGMRVELPEEEFLQVVRKVGCAVIGQTQSLVPADKRLYALRDVTGTVDSVPLIASSIMSKKIAGGAGAIVLDVKVGSGALMKTVDDCIRLATAMVDIGARVDRRVIAMITGMEEPLGSHIGNALEVKDAIDVLSGRTQGPLLEVSLKLGEQMLVAGGLAQSEREACDMLLNALRSGAGLNKLKDMIAAQGGDPAVCDDVSRLPLAKKRMEVTAGQSGYVNSMDAEAVGRAALYLGAGRQSKEDVIDLSVGLILNKRVGDAVQKGESLFTLYYQDEDKAKQAQALLNAVVKISGEPTPKARLFYARVTTDGVEEL